MSNERYFEWAKSKKKCTQFFSYKIEGICRGGGQMRDMFQEVRRTACKFYTAQQIVIWKRRSVNK